MALITTFGAAPLTNEGLTLADLLRNVIKELGLGTYGTATGGSATTLIDTNELLSTQYNSNQWVGGWLQIVRDAGGAGAAPEGESRPITTYAPATGTITVNPGFSVAPAAGDSYIVWNYPNANKILELVNDCLRQDLYIPCWTILTEVPDGDMEQNNITDWTASGTSVAKETLPTLSVDSSPMWGKRWLKVSGTGHAETTKNISVSPNKRYHFSALVLPQTAAFASIQLRDATNNAEIGRVTAATRAMARLMGSFITPATCQQVSIRLATTSGSLAYFDEVCLYAEEAREIRLPWWVRQRNQVLGICQSWHENTGQSNGLVMNPEPNVEPDDAWYVVDDAIGRSGLRAANRYDRMGNRPYYLFGLRNEEPYANFNVDKKAIDEKLFTACVCWRILNMLGSPSYATVGKGTDYKETVARFSNLYTRLANQQMESLKRVMNQPAQQVYVTEPLNTIRY